jgi:hypothetical protein
VPRLPPGAEEPAFAAQANEPKGPQQVAVAAGRLGIDLPQPYDIVATNLAALCRHHWLVGDSDHDCVGVTVDLLARQRHTVSWTEMAHCCVD